ncbi:MAG: MmcQ/YjbR family DNA-binding protein [Acidobacteriota bacterium]
MSTPLERLRKICLGLPEATEEMGFGHPVFNIRKKCFAAFESSGGRPAIAVRIDPLDAGIFAADARFFATPYGRGKWISLWADGKTDWKLVGQLVEASYRMVAPKRVILRRP